MALRDISPTVMPRLRLTGVAVVVWLIWASTPAAERMGYPPEEFAARRQRLAAALKGGTLVMFGATTPTPGLRFRQDNDFFYLTGNEALNAALVMDAATRRNLELDASLAGRDEATLARLARLDNRQSTAIAIELSIHNAVLALAVGATIATVLTVPAAVYASFMFIPAGLFAWLMYGRNREAISQ